MKPDIKIKEISERPTITIRESATMASIPVRIGKIYSEIITFMSKKGIAPAGAPFAYWHNMNSESMNKGVFDMECGFPIGAPVEGEGQVKLRRRTPQQSCGACKAPPHKDDSKLTDQPFNWIICTLSPQQSCGVFE